MLKVGGENVAPAEIEELLCKLAGVDSAVVGRRDERLQEVPVAFLVPTAGSCPGEEDVIGSLKGKIARYEIPARVISWTSCR